jgi:hypothetical protein
MSNHAQIMIFAKPLVRKSRTVFGRNLITRKSRKSRFLQNRWSGNHATNHGNHAASNHETHTPYKGVGFSHLDPDSPGCQVIQMDHLGDRCG